MPASTAQAPAALSRVLLVEDDERIAGPLTEGLRRHGFTVDRATTGAGALRAPVADLVLLDPGLPDMDGVDVCRGLRARSAVPIIVITARGDDADGAAGPASGADAFLVKPFGVRELVARMRAVSRRRQPRPVPSSPACRPDVHRVGPLTVDPRTREAAVDGRRLVLSAREFGLLVCLVSDPGTALCRRQLMDEVWGPQFFGPAGTLDVHVAALRRKLGDPAWITSVRGAGLRLTAPEASPGS